MKRLENDKVIDLSLKELIAEMHTTIHNNERYCFSDTFIDIEYILDYMEEHKSFTLYWGIRRSGTTLRDDLSNIDKNYYKEVYKIIFEDSKFSKIKLF